MFFLNDGGLTMQTFLFERSNNRKVVAIKINTFVTFNDFQLMFGGKM